jgi:hypothetical protein
MNMTRTGQFITPEELNQLKTELGCSGMWTSSGLPIGDAERYVSQLSRQYGMPDCGIDPTNGEWVRP